MKVFNLSMMLTVHLSYVLLILSLFATVCSFPSTPLNKKNQEISWEAWLLVDDQNQSQNRQAQGEHNTPKHRITPKSVFVAPTFSPKDLPPCADGYNSDSMGRCIKIIKLREENQLMFLLNKLNDEFGSDVDYDTIPEEPNSSPTRVDIPLVMDFGDEFGSDLFEEEHDMAIIVTPTSKASDKDADDNNKVDKRDQKVNEDVFEEELKKLLQVTTSSTQKYDAKSEAEPISTTEVEALPTTTDALATERVLAEDSSTQDDRMDTTVIPTTVTMAMEETTTFDAQGSFTQTEFSDSDATTASEVTSVLPTTTEVDDTTTTLESRSVNMPTSTTPKITTYHPVATTYHPFFDLSLVGHPRTKNFVKFPSEETAIPRSYPNGNYVRFPDFDSKYQQESLVHHTRDVDDQTGNFFNEIVTPEPSEQIQDFVLPPKRHYDYKSEGGFVPKVVHQQSNPYGKSHVPLVNQQHYQFQIATTEQFPIKRAKEKYSSLVAPKWSSEDIHKPIVLRSLPMDDLTYLFGHKNGHTSHR